MSRPDYVDIASTLAAWDALLNDNYNILRQSFPFPEYVDLPTLIADRPPAQNEGCAAAVSTPSWTPYWCDGVTWSTWPGTIAPHAPTHEAGGSDVIPHQNLDGAGVNDHPAIDAHIANTSNPHAVTAAQAGADPAGTGAAEVAAHVALPDPHTQYQLESEKGVANGYASLDGSGQVPASQLPPFTGLVFQGFWNANTNSPALSSGVGTEGHFYVVNVAGSTNLDGITDWQIGDWAVFFNSAWNKLDNTDSVTSVNGQTGVVVLNAADVGAAAAVHAPNHSQGGSDPITGENLASAGTVDQDLVPDGAGGLTLVERFGARKFYAELTVPAPVTAGNNVFVQYLNVNTPSLPAGDYFYHYEYGWSINATNADFRGQVSFDGNQLINPGDTLDHVQEPADAGGAGIGGTNQRHVCSGSGQITLAGNAVRNLIMQYARNGGFGGLLFTVYYFRFILYRVG